MDGLTVTGCERCADLVTSRSQIVNGVGPVDAEVLFIGEAPGEQEDEEGEPFVGRSGGILDEVLGKRGFSRDRARITNCVRCRPPANRDPTSEERANCRGYLDAEIQLVDPALIVTLGKVPSELVLDRSVAVTNEAGRIEQLELAGARRAVMVCVHPAASLYDPEQRDTLEATIDTAIEYIGEGDQSSLGDF